MGPAPRPSRLALLSSVSVCAVLAAAPVRAQTASCTAASGGTTTSCTISAGTYTAIGQITATGSTGSGSSAGQTGPTYTLTNNGTFNLNAASQYWGLYVFGTGGNGSSDPSDAGPGGTVTINNNGAVTFSGSGSSNSVVYGLYARSDGGTGGTNSGGIGNHDGGRGGDGGLVFITNTAAVSIQQALPGAGVAIYAESTAGPGGDQDSGVGDQKGGNSGDGKDISITNSGAVSIGTSSAPVAGRNYGWGIGAEAKGNTGGDDNGEGGTGGNITITNTGPIAIYWNAQDATANGVRGIYAQSRGGNGTTSNDDSDAGGRGEAGYQITASTSGNITIVATGTEVTGVSGGIVAVSQGGDGGGAPGKNVGGAGANGSDTTGGVAGVMTVSVNSGATISTTGNNISGVVTLSAGGRGGDGQSGENDSSGGNGGSGGQIQMNMYGTAVISTNGANAYGLLGQSIGGQGGNAGNSSAVLGTTGSGGYGGNGGAVGVYTESSARITTHGDFSAGIALHSIGGGGGTGGDFTDVLGGGAGNGGNGGDSGRADASNAATITTSGQHSYGILVQSIAGSGGTGGIAQGLTLELGGDGGAGGTAGAANVNNTGAITTTGYSAHGIVAQSISGGGGAAGTSGGAISIGGTGGGTSTTNGGAVTVSNTAAIQTSADAAVGIIAQSIGGGGGTGGGSTGIASIGGQGSAGGSGGSVSVFTKGGSAATTGEWAHGIMAQSIGGGGGNGGNALDLSVFVPGLGIGGNASVAGSGGAVCVTNMNPSNNACATGSTTNAPVTITTGGPNAIGILAQSIGGGGGNGGNATGVDVVSLATIQLGGTGGAGGNGGTVDVNYQGLTLTTQGSHGSGVVAQSIGGGGGNAGSASAYSGSFGFTMAVAIGQKGGAGGSGNTASLVLEGSTIRTGQGGGDVTDAYGVVVQSIGGGGGVGGSSTADAITAAEPTGEDVSFAVAISAAVGGVGGTGGSGSAASASVIGGTGVTTAGTGSHGVLVQSIGGGGGSGGTSSALSATAGVENTVSADVSLSLGGSGGTAGAGGAASASLSGSTVTTTGDYANAVVVQSIGGGGGNAGAGSSDKRQIGGGFNLTATIGVGGSGGNGSGGGAATFNQDIYSTITTSGAGARGALVQSIGGGGGASQGASVGLSASDSSEQSDVTATVTVSVGRSGAGAAAGGTVTSSTYGAINTTGGDADGVLLQSIGGGGGLGGSITSGKAASSGPLSDEGTSYDFNVGVGGKGGIGGNGGAINITHGGKITTTGDYADGLVAQSIGGGGGTGGSSTITGSQRTANVTVGVGGSGGLSGAGGTITVSFDDSHQNQITTSGYMAHGVLLQSIGGGGGQGGDGSDKATGSLTIGGAAGGSGSPSGNGGTIQTTGSGSWINITTRGADAYGLVAQSIGGGGGIGGAGNSTASTDDDSHTFDVVVGGKGGASGAGGTVNLTLGTNLFTTGDRAFGVVAQSIGGGGGIGGVGSKDNVTSLVLGGQGSTGGNGGNVTLNLTRTTIISTKGAGAHGVIAQSIGGGGGIGGDTSGGPVSVITYNRSSSSPNGASGAVSVTVDASITTTGANAFGIIAQSVGGGGGFGGDQNGVFAGFTGTPSGSADLSGAVTVTQTGTVTTSGANSVGIFAQSQGGQGNAVVAVTVNGTVTGGSGAQGAGVWVAAGVHNTMTVNASGRISAASGLAINYTGDGTTSYGSTLTVQNYGTISGNVTMTNLDGNTAGSVTNEGGGTLSDAAIYQASVVNRGTLIVGGADRVDATRITGNLTQEAGGVLTVRADFANAAADHLRVDGNAALAGQVQVLTTSALPNRAVPFLGVGGTLTQSLTPRSGAIFDYGLDQSGKEMSLSVTAARFGDSSLGLNSTQRSVASHLQAIWNAGGGQFGTLFGTLGELADGDAGTYRSSLSNIATGAAGAVAASAIARTQQISDQLMSCPVFEKDSSFLTETSCAWTQIGAQRLDQDAKDGAGGFDTTTYGISTGGQFQVAPDWFVGFTVGYDRSRIRGDGGQIDADGDTAYAGVAVKRQIGPWLLSAGLGGSYGWYDGTRTIAIPGFEGQAKSDPRLSTLNGRLRAAYTFAGEQHYIRPMVDLDLMYTRSKGFTESGAGVLDLTVDSQSQWSLHATPAIEVGARMAVSETTLLRAYARAGVSLSNQDDWQTTARFASAPAGVGGFESEMPLAKVAARLAAGLDLANRNGFNLRLEYQGSFADTYTSHGGALRASYSW